MELTNEQIDKFSSWLSDQGVEVLPSISEHELVKFRCRFGTGIIYTGKGELDRGCNNLFVKDAVKCYHNGIKWRGKGKPAKRIKGSKRKRELFDRDGDECFYCGERMPFTDMTKEHIFSINQGGLDHINNTVLAHEECNKAAGHLPIIEKIKLRDRMRKET